MWLKVACRSRFSKGTCLKVVVQGDCREESLAERMVHVRVGGWRWYLYPQPANPGLCKE